MKKYFLLILTVLGLIINVSANSIVEEYEDGCNNQNNPYSCESAGEMYMNGVGVTKNFLKSKKYFNLAIQYFEDRCHNGQYNTCEDIAEHYREGDIVKKSLKKAIKYYDIACNYGKKSLKRRSCEELGDIYIKIGTSASLAKGLKALDKACKAENKKSCFVLAMVYGGYMPLNGIGKNINKSRYYATKYTDIFDKSCKTIVAKKNKNFQSDMGYIKNSLEFSCIKLGAIYSTGGIPIVKKDENKAEKYFDMAYEYIGAEAYSLIANSFLSRKSKDCSKYFTYMKKSCIKGFSQACNNIAVFHIKKYRHKFLNSVSDASYIGQCGYKHFKNNFIKAFELYDKSCDLGNSMGCYLCGEMYKNGYGVTKNYKRALEYYQQSCNADNMDGCAAIGNIYQHGLGVIRDYTKAKKYYKKACDNGFTDACEEYNRLSN